MTQNPWSETCNKPVKAALLNLLALHRQTTEKAPRPFSKHIQDLWKAADLLKTHWQRNPELYRQNRMLAVVLIPELIKTVQTCQCPKTAGLPENIQTALKAKLEEGTAILLQEAQELNKSSTENLVADLNLPSPIKEEHEEHALTGIFSSGWGATQNAFQKVAEVTENGAKGIWNRGKGAALMLNSQWEDITPWLNAPRNHWTRTREGLAAMWTQGIIGTTLRGLRFEGVLLCALFPPAIPVVVGVSLLEGGVETWDKATKEHDHRLTSQENLRRTQQKQAKAQAKALLQGQDGVVSFSTDCVHTIVDLSTGRRDGVILKGQHAGASLDDLAPEIIETLANTAPDEDTRNILNAWNAGRK